MESWIEANIFVEQGKENEFLLNFIKPLVQRLRSKFKITSFHFFREPEIRFRVLTEADKVEAIKNLIEEGKKTGLVKDIKYPLYGEDKSAFGEGGWASAHKFFEAGSEIALDYIDPSVKKGKYFDHIAFMHYFLNPSGFSFFDEGKLHAVAVIERLDRIRMSGRMTDNQILQLKDKIKALEERLKS